MSDIQLRKANAFIKKLSVKYKILNNNDGINVGIRCGGHILDRLNDREINTSVFNSIVTRLIRYNMCELIYLIESGERRINIYGDDDYMIGVHGNPTSYGNYKILLTTIYKERNRKNRERVVKTAKLELKTKQNFYQLSLES